MYITKTDICFCFGRRSKEGELMKELIFTFLLLGIVKGIGTLATYNRETGNRRKIVSILEYRNRAALAQH